MNFFKKNAIKKIISYIIIGNLFIYNFSNIVLGATGTIIYVPDSSTPTSGNVTATIGSFDESGVVVTNVGGDTHVFTDNGTFDFELSGDLTTGTVTASVNRIDKTSPSVTLTGNRSGYTNTGFTMTVDFSEAVTGFETGDLVIINGTLSNFQTISGSQYTFDVAPTATGLITIDLAADQCTDLVGNGNIVATQFSIIYDISPSTISFTNAVETGPVLTDTVSVNRGDASSTQYKLIASTGDCDGLGTITYTGDLIFADETNNNKYVCLYAEDAAGNTGTLTSDNKLNIDITKPTASAEFNTTGRTNSGVIVTITGFLEAITGLNATGFLFTGNGDYVFTFQDIVGNTGTLTGTIFRIDTTPITGYVEYSTTGYTNTGVIATMTGFNKTGVIVSGGAEYIFTENTGYMFYYTDLAGNTGETLATVTRIDMEFPIFSGASTGASYDTGIAITFSDTHISGATVNGLPYNSGNPITNEGINIFVVTDLAGNSTGVTFFIDTTTPIITLNGTSVITLEVFSPYIESGAVRLDNGLTGVANISGTVNTGALGPYILTYRYSDGFHLSTTGRTINIVDTTLPIITINGSGTITVERTQSYSELGAERSDNYDGTGTVIGINIIGTVDNQTSGTYILTYQYVDNSHNTGATTRTINVIDTTSPIASIEYSTTGLINQDVLATITEFSEDITGLNETGFLFTGNGSFIFTFQDIYGNPGSGTATVSWIDKTPVTGTIVYNIIGRTSGDVTVEITGFNKTGVTITSSGSYIFTGNDSYVFTYIDSYGNTGSDTAVVTGIDKTAPLITNTGTTTVSTGGADFNGIQITEIGIGIDTITLNYSGIVNATGIGSIGLSTGNLTNVSGTIAGLNDNQTYIYTITATDLLGNTTTITGGFFTTLFDYQEQYIAVAAALQSANISGNLNTVTNANVGSFSGLYFEQTAGKIEFLNAVDLSDTGTIAFLQDLNNYLFMSGGFINFTVSNSTTDSGSALQNIQARLTMYLDPALLPDGALDESLIVVKDNNGNIITPSSSVISNLNCTGTSPQVCTFIANHFTSFGVKPILSGVNIQSNNALGSRALSGNIITLSFTGSENLTGVSVTMFGNSASVVGAGAAWTAIYTTNGSEADGPIPFTINFEDLFGNAGDTVTGTTDFSLVTFDKTLPIIIINNPDILPAQSKTITATGSDFNFSGFFMSITGTNTCDGTLIFQTYTSLTFTGESDNGTYVCYKTIDFAGNVTYAGSAMITGIDTMKPNASIDYNPASGAWTNTDVLATLTGYSETLTGINQTTYNFANSGTFNFTFSDLAGNTGETLATVSRIDKTQPTFTGVTSGAYYSGDKSIAFSDTNLSGATLDGSAYNSGDVISSEGIHIFIVNDLAGNSTGATFTIDKTQPIFAGVTSGAYYNTNQAITFSDTNLSGATLNGVAYNSGDVISTDGVKIFIVTDRAGNSTGATFILDKTLPTVGTGIISAGNTGVNGTTGYYNGTITIKTTMSDTNISGATCEYSTGTTRASATYTGGGGYCSISGLSPAANISVRFRVQDLAGNLNTGGITTYVYDITTPTTTNNANSTTGRIDVPVTLSPADTGVGLSGTRYCVDTGGTCTPTLSGTSVSVTGTAGVITHKYVRYYSVDKLNNTETTKTSVMINIDKETPVLTGTTTFSSNNSTNTGYAKVGNTITVLFQSHETLTGTPTMTVSGGSLTTGTVTNIGGNNYSGTYVMKITDTEGTIGFNILMTDLVGNTGTIQVTSTIIFDRTNPAGISITSPTNTTYFQGGMTRTITWNIGTEINFGPTSLVLQYSNDGWSTLHSIISTGTANNGSYTRTFPVVDSTMASVRILATDLAGNTANFTGNQFTLDSTQPTDVTITYPSGGEFFKGGSGYTITWSGGTDNFLSGKTIEYSTNGFFPGTTIFTDTMNSFSYLWTAPAINSSGVKLKITVVDRAGLNKVAETSAFYIDSTKPTLTFTDTNSARRNTNATGTATASDTLAGLRTTGILYRTDTQFDQYCNGGSTTIPVLSADGTGYVYACVMDKAGNVTTGVQTYKIDKTAPLLTMPVDKITNTGTTIDITVNGNVSGISGYTRTKLSGTGTITFTTPTIQDPIVTGSGDGLYVLQVVVKDNANNVTTGTINFTRHIIAPVLTGTTVSVSNTTATFAFTGNETGNVTYSGACGTGSLISAISGSNTTTFTLANAIYSGCKLQVTDSANNISSRLIIPTFPVNYTAPSGGGGGGGGGGGLPTCLSTQLMCVNNVYVVKTGVYCQGGNLTKTCGTDLCVDGDYSGDPSDGLCKDPTKVEAITGVTSTGKRVLFSSPFNKELTDAYFYAYNIKITTVSDIKRANMTGILIRSHLSKMISEYMMKVLGKTPDTTRKCIFSDMNNQTEEFKRYAIISCQLGLMGLKTDGTPADKFNPDNQVTRAIFGTTLSRALRGDKYNGGQNRYAEHLQALKESNIMTQIESPFNRELRGYIMLMMMRTDRNIIKSSYLNFTSLRGTSIFVPSYTNIIITSQYTATELAFINNLNKEYHFSEGYTAGQTSAGVKYLQYFLKAKQYYTGSINGINTQATLDALFQFQLDNDIVTDENDTGAGYLGPTTRETINPLLQKLLNP